MTQEELFHIAQWPKMSRAEQDAYVQQWYDKIRPQLVLDSLAAGMWPECVEYLDKGGAVYFSFHGTASLNSPLTNDAIEQHFLAWPKFDSGPVFQVGFCRDALDAIEPKQLDKHTFLGANFDRLTGRIERKLPRVEVGVPMGEFAAAFARPPHGIRLSEEELQSLFDELLEKLCLDDPNTVILDWASPELSSVSNYFEAGLEWWGAFLWTIEVPDQSQIVVISASSTD